MSTNLRLFDGYAPGDLGVKRKKETVKAASFRNEHESVIGFVLSKILYSLGNDVKFRLICVNEKLNIIPGL